MTSADRIAAIRARLDVLPDFIGILKSGSTGGWIMSPGGERTYISTDTDELHEYVAHAYGDLRWLLRRYEDARERLEHLRSGCAADTACAACLDEHYAEDREAHWEAIAREHLEAE